MSNLEDQIKRTARFYRPSTPLEVRKVLDYLDAKLQDYDPSGKVVAVLVRDMENHRINHYYDHTASRPIPDEVIHRELNLTIGGEGTTLMGTIAHPEPHRISGAYQKGYFVQRKDLGPESRSDPLFESQYVALINIPLDLGSYTFTIHSFRPRLD